METGVFECGGGNEEYGGYPTLCGDVRFECDNAECYSSDIA